MDILWNNTINKGTNVYLELIINTLSSHQYGNKYFNSSKTTNRGLCNFC